MKVFAPLALIAVVEGAQWHGSHRSYGGRSYGMGRSYGGYGGRSYGSGYGMGRSYGSGYGMGRSYGGYGGRSYGGYGAW